MIPPVNDGIQERAATIHKAWNEACDNGADKHPRPYRNSFGSPPEIGLKCDCCGRVVTCIAVVVADSIDQIPYWVKVAGNKYFGCSVECARVLFNIHHQYAIQEVSKVGRAAP